MIAGIFGGSGFVAPCTRVLSNSDLSRRFVHRTSDRSRSEVLCTHGGQPSELVQSPSENDTIKPVWNRSLCVKISVCLSTLGKGMGKRLGYARVSTDDQRLDLQRDALTRAGCADIYEEKVSGKSADRPAL
ncbi:TPA: recombinase family protein, partial [Citrobacter braakii]